MIYIPQQKSLNKHITTYFAKDITFILNTMETAIYMILYALGGLIVIGLIIGLISLLFTEWKEYTLSTIFGGGIFSYVLIHIINNYWISIIIGTTLMLAISFSSKRIRSYISLLFVPYFIVFGSALSIIGWYFFQSPNLGACAGLLVSIVLVLLLHKNCPQCGSFNTRRSGIRTVYERGEYWPYEVHGLFCNDCSFGREDWEERHE